MIWTTPSCIAWPSPWADQLREADSQNHPGRWRSNPAAGGTVEAIVAEVLGRLQVSDRGCAELVR